MCNDYANHVPWSAYVEAFSEIKLPVVLPKAALNLEPRDDIWPTDVAPIIRPAPGGVEIAQIRWGSRAAAEGAAGDQLPLGRPPLRERPLPRPRVPVL
jgi:putative SOS response-associated peptidase YedK